MTLKASVPLSIVGQPEPAAHLIPRSACEAAAHARAMIPSWFAVEREQPKMKEGLEMMTLQNTALKLSTATICKKNLLLVLLPDTSSSYITCTNTNAPACIST